jgi:hypothetical protein
MKLGRATPTVVVSDDNTSGEYTSMVGNGGVSCVDDEATGAM